MSNWFIAASVTAAVSSCWSMLSIVGDVSICANSLPTVSVHCLDVSTYSNNSFMRRWWSL